jgi:hypothetical protein
MNLIISPDGHYLAAPGACPRKGGQLLEVPKSNIIILTDKKLNAIILILF